MKRLTGLLTSRSLAVSLLGILLFLLVLGALLPKIDFVEYKEALRIKAEQPYAYFLAERLSPPRLVRQPFFYLIAGMLFLQNAMCLFQRIRVSPKQAAFGAGGMEHSVLLPVKMCDPMKVLASFSASIGGNLHEGKVLDEGENYTWHGVKGKYGYWGSLVFHLSFIVIFAGIFLSAYYGFYGSLLITEGQRLKLNSLDSYIEINRKPLGEFSVGNLEVNLKKFERIYQKGEFTDYIANTELFNGDYPIGEHQIKVNQPLKFEGIKLVLDQYGYAPLFTIRDNSGNVVQDAYYNLKVLTTVQTDSISLPDGKTVNLRFFPDFEQKGQNIRTKSEFPGNPVFMAKWGQDKGLLSLGKSLKIGRWELTFSNLGYWVLFRVAKDPGEPVLYFGFLMSLIGIGLRLYFPRVGYRLSIRGDRDTGYTGEISINARGITGQPEIEMDRAVKKIKSIVEKE